MGPFYELESSSPAANLKPGEKLVHRQRIMHFEGNEEPAEHDHGKSIWDIVEESEGDLSMKSLF